MNLSGTEYQRLLQALLSAYPTQSDLAQFVRIHLDENLRAIVNVDSLNTATFELIRWAQSRGRLPDLIRAAHADRPHNDTFADFASEVGVGEEPLSHTAEPPTDAHPGNPAPVHSTLPVGGQTQIDGNVEAGGDFIGRDNTVHGNQVREETVTYIDKQYIGNQADNQDRNQPTPPPEKESGSLLSRGSIAWGLAIIGLIASLITIAQWLRPTTVPESTPPVATAAPAAAESDAIEAPSFDYTIIVVDNETGDPVTNAQVQIYIEGRAPLQRPADSRGFARIPIPAAFAERPGQLTVTATGYHVENRNIDLWPDQLPTQIRLQRE